MFYSGSLYTFLSICKTMIFLKGKVYFMLHIYLLHYTVFTEELTTLTYIHEILFSTAVRFVVCRRSYNYVVRTDKGVAQWYPRLVQ